MASESLNVRPISAFQWSLAGSIFTRARIKFFDQVDQAFEYCFYEFSEFGLEDGQHSRIRKVWELDFNDEEESDVKCQADYSAGHFQAICPDSEPVEDAQLVNKPPGKFGDFSNSRFCVPLDGIEHR